MFALGSANKFPLKRMCKIKIFKSFVIDDFHVTYEIEIHRRNKED